MSGHSKWANIKRKKQANDKVRGNVFSKLSRIITLSVLEGNSITDPNLNVKLRLAVEKAKSLNMPKDNIQRAIDRGVGPNKESLKEVIYEAFAPGGAALIILATTDNLNRTLSEIRNVLERNGGKMGNQGSVSYLFKKCALVVFPKNEVNEEVVFDFAEKINAFDIDQDEERYTLYIPFENLGKIKDHQNGLRYESAEVDFKPTTLITVTKEKDLGKILDLIEALEDLDDVQKVYGNFVPA
jgi:YebC/PmpR family DNA-binding regulatory protein